MMKTNTKYSIGRITAVMFLSVFMIANLICSSAFSLHSKASNSIFRTFEDLTENQLKALATVCQSEQGTAVGAAAEASLMANLIDMGTNNAYKYPKTGQGLYQYVKEDKWFSGAAGYMDTFYTKNTPPEALRDDVLEAVRSVLIYGKRTLPGYIDEHDDFGTIKSCTNNGKNVAVDNRSNYQQHVTVLVNYWGAVYTFYCFPDSRSDPFGYMHEEKREAIGEAYYDFYTGELVNGEDTGNTPVGEIYQPFKIEPGKLTISGWAYDPDNQEDDVRINIYRDSVSDNTILAKDVVANKQNALGFCDFEVTIPITQDEEMHIIVIAKNLEGTGGEDLLLYEGNVRVSASQNLGSDFVAVIKKDAYYLSASSDGSTRIYSRDTNNKYWDNLTATKYHWHFIEIGSNTYSIWSYNGGKALEAVTNADGSVSGKLTDKYNKANANDRWHIVKVGNGFGLSPESHPSCVLALPDNYSNGSDLKLAERSDSDTKQIFAIQNVVEDNELPTIASATSQYVDNSTFKITVKTDDNFGIRKVQVVTHSWKGKDKGQITYDAVQSSNNYRIWECKININDSSKNKIFNNLYGAYYSEIYAYDYKGNRQNLIADIKSYDSTGSVSRELQNEYCVESKVGVYTLTMDANGGSVNEKSKILVYGGTYNRNSPLPTPTRTGYTFDGWYTAKTDGTLVTNTTKVTKTANHTIYAHWKQNEYTLTLYPTGGTISNADFTGKTTNVVTSATKLIFNGPNWIRVKSYIPTRTGYTFTGFYTAASGGTKVYGADGNCTNEGKYFKDNLYVYPGNLKVFAQWKVNTYTVTFDANGGKTSETSRTVTFDKTYGASKALPTLTRTGYSFEGWYTEKDGGYKVTDTTKVTMASNHTLYAHWKINKVNVHYNANGGTIASGGEYYLGSDSNVYKSADQKIVDNYWSYNQKYEKGLYNAGTFKLTRKGYTFTGWGTDQKGSKIYDQDDGTVSANDLYPDITTKSGTITVYAQWKANTYTVTFAANSGTCAEISRKVTYDSNYSASKALPTPTREGYTFAGWFTDDTFQTQVTDQTKVGIAKDHTLYAKWEKPTQLVTEATTVEPSVVKGDVNGDSSVSVQDILALQKWILAVPGARLDSIEAADINSDGMIDIFDLALLKHKFLR